MIRPAIVGDLSWVKASYDSISGMILSEWKRSGSMLSMRVTIPANTRATVFVPTSEAGSVKFESSLGKGGQFVRETRGHAVYEVGAGSYVISARL